MSRGDVAMTYRARGAQRASGAVAPAAGTPLPTPVLVLSKLLWVGRSALLRVAAPLSGGG